MSLPRLRTPRVRRPALLDRLDAGLHQKLTLLSAPAGFGKTTLAAEWVARRLTGEAVEIDLAQPLTAAWVALDSGDNEPLRFWRYFFTAAQAFDRAASAEALALLYTTQQADLEAVLTGWINALAPRPGQAVLVLEDYHLISNAEIHAALTFLLNHQPAALHLVLLTRSDPPLPLARLRARDEVNELRAADLRFSAAEVQEFIQQSLPHPLPEEMARRLAERTEGWAAGLRLATLALLGRPDSQAQAHFLDTFTGSHRPVLEYLAADVLASQPEPIQTFLLETSFLPHLNGALCDAVTGRSDSAAMLDQLERANLFLEPVDGTGQWYRFHALFAEAMRFAAEQRLGRARLRALAERASDWYARREMNCEAVEAAFLAEAYERAADLIEGTIAPALAGNEYHTLLRWLQNVPEDVLRQRPVLCMTYAQAMLFTAGLNAETAEQALSRVAMAEQVWAAAGHTAGLGQALALRALIAIRQGDHPRSFMLARQALERLPEEATEWRGVCLTFTGYAAYMAGQMNTALQEQTEARRLLQAARNIFGLINTMIALGEIYALQDAPQQAVELFRSALDEVERAPFERKDKLRRRGRARLGLASLALDANDLETAEREAAQVVAIGHELGSEDLVLGGERIQAGVLAARGQVEAARERLSALAARLQQPRLLGQIHLWQARLALAAGDLAAVQRWAARRQSGPPLAGLFQEQETLLRARLELASGRPEAAVELLHPWLADALTHGRTRSVVEIHVLMAQAEAARGCERQARQALLEAATAAQPAHYLRIYLDEGEELAALVERLTVECAESEFAGCAAALGAVLQRPGRSPTEPALAIAPEAVEPLSQQEQRVLRLLAGGLSNPEIAEELVVSVNTVKTHVKSIYRKLNVNSRSQVRAATRSTSLQL